MDMEESIRDLLRGPKFPDKEFVRSGATFGEVYAMAGWLRTTLAAPEYQGAPICLAAADRGVLAAALLASLAGGPSLLLPYAFSPPSFARMRERTGFTIAVSDLDREFPAGTTVLRPRPGNSGGLGAAPESELLQIFTGGSTGAPQIWSKTGVNMFGEGFALARHFAVSKEDCIVATVPPYHIYGLLFSVILPLVSSATVIAETPVFPGEIAAAAQEHEATVLACIPPHYRAMRQKPIRDASLRIAFSSAGMLDEEDNDAFFRLNKVGIVEIYGSTETGGIAARNRALGETAFTAFPAISWKIKDQRLCVRSPYLSPELSLHSDGFFTTGDRVEPGGPNEFILKGRSDGVTKVGGKRVDLEEVRALIRKAPGVSDCVVMALPESGSRENRIVTLVQGTDTDIDQIRKTLAGSLESYALPRIIKTTTRIPMKENGKYDRDTIIRLFET